MDELKPRRRGRHPGIPTAYFVRVFRAKLRGDGYGTIAKQLNALGVATSRGSVERLCKGLAPYTDEILGISGGDLNKESAD